MKKNLFFVAAAALMLASCSNDVKIDENVAVVGSNVQKEIAFSPLAKKPNRKPAAANDTYQYAIDGTSFPHDLNMYVAAYQVEPTPAGNFFAGTQFVFDNAGGTGASSGYWGGATPRYWPLYECYINFLAYANVTGDAAFNNTTPASAAVITQSDNSSAQTDLMYAIGQGAVTKNNANALVIPTKVDMEFKHAQAWMDFYVKANSSTETAITINSITLKGAKYSGTYTITHTNYNAKASQSVAGAWTSLGDAAEVTVPGWTPVTLTTSLVHVGKGLLIVPDDDGSSNDWTSFVISYTSGNNNYEYEYTPLDGAANVDQSKHYVFNITFKMHEIFVAATVADWTDASPVAEDVP